jgi:HK97 family phage major capsid protein
MEITKEEIKQLAKEEAEKVKELKEQAEKKVEEKSVEEKPIHVIPEKKDRTIEFFKALFERDYVQAKALSEGAGSAGGYLVPEEFASNVLQLITDYGIIRKNATVIPMKSNQLSVPVLGTRVEAAWITEANAPTATQPVFSQAVLSANKAGVIVPMTRELLEDANVDVVKFLQGQFAQAFAKTEDAAGLNGTSPFTGVLQDSNVTSVTMATGATTFDAVTLDNLIDLTAAVPSYAQAGAAFIMHPTVYSYIMKLKTTTNAPIFDVATGKLTILGYPVYLSNAMPSTSAVSTPFILFGNLKNVLFGDRKQIEIALADQATIGTDNLFAQDMVALRAIERVAINVALPEAFAKLVTAAS